VSSEIIEQVLPYTNLFLYDLKHMNSNEHQIMVKVPNEKILSNARLIAKTDIENVIINEAIYYHLLKKEQVKLGVDAEDSARTAALIVVSIYRSCTDLHRLNEVAPNNQLKLERLYRVCLDFIWDGFYESLRQGRTPIPVFPLAPEHNSFYEKTFKESCALVAM
jgi:pyruvate-formate lyase-activating enzyme